MRRLLSLCGAGFVCLFMSGCSFQRAWHGASGQATESNDITGRWQGTWKSDANGHNDKLRCIITKTDEIHYQARFHAKYKKVLSFSYAVPLTVTNDHSQFRFQGQANLGKLAGGLYTYDGSATPTDFTSRYNSKYDRGTFQMSRPRE